MVNHVVFVQVFHSGNESNPHTSLRQEVIFLRKLRHPSIITMVGVCVKPWSLIMELAPLGSLTTLLNRHQALSKGIQHRVALQVRRKHFIQCPTYKLERSHPPQSVELIISDV